MANETDQMWKSIVELANSINQVLKDKPQNLRLGFQCSPGGILNAFREGDVSFDNAVLRLEEWKERAIAREKRGKD